MHARTWHARVGHSPSITSATLAYLADWLHAKRSDRQLVIEHFCLVLYSVLELSNGNGFTCLFNLVCKAAEWVRAFPDKYLDFLSSRELDSWALPTAVYSKSLLWRIYCWYVSGHLKDCWDLSSIAGYAGYVPAKLPPARLSASQEALRQIKSSETLATIETLLRNVAVDQSQENTKRRVRLTNKTIEKLIVNEKGGLEAMKALGWVSDPDDSDFLIVPKGTQISMSQVILTSLRSLHMIPTKEDVQYLALEGAWLCSRQSWKAS